MAVSTSGTLSDVEPLDVDYVGGEGRVFGRSDQESTPGAHLGEHAKSTLAELPDVDAHRDLVGRNDTADAVFKQQPQLLVADLIDVRLQRISGEVVSQWVAALKDVNRRQLFAPQKFVGHRLVGLETESGTHRLEDEKLDLHL